MAETAPVQMPAPQLEDVMLLHMLLWTNDNDDTANRLKIGFVSRAWGCLVHLPTRSQQPLTCGMLLLLLLQPVLEEIKAERHERAQLGAFSPYQRTIP
jgi:hypothetical protein